MCCTDVSTHTYRNIVTYVLILSVRIDLFNNNNYSETKGNKGVEKMDRNMEYHADTQTLLGKKSKTYIDEETGEKIKAEQITKRAYGQRHFWKIYLMDFLQILGVLESKQVDVFIYILENTEQANNTFIGSQRDIAKACDVSLDTVSRIMKKLQENDFIKQIKRSVYQVSPNVMMKGSEHKKSLILNYYNDSESDES